MKQCGLSNPTPERGYRCVIHVLSAHTLGGFRLTLTWSISTVLEVEPATTTRDKKIEPTDNVISGTAVPIFHYKSKAICPRKIDCFYFKAIMYMKCRLAVRFGSAKCHSSVQVVFHWCIDQSRALFSPTFDERDDSQKMEWNLSHQTWISERNFVFQANGESQLIYNSRDAVSYYRWSYSI